MNIKVLILVIALFSLASAQWFITDPSDDDEQDGMDTQKRTVHSRVFTRLINGLNSYHRNAAQQNQKERENKKQESKRGNNDDDLDQNQKGAEVM
jgi:hypothetical protein